jgi:hypothetical protein
LQDSIGTASSRIQVVIEAAEKAAAGIIDDAEAQARTYLEESRRRADLITDQRAREVASMTDALIECAEAAKRQSDELLVVLDQARVKVDEALQVHLPEKPTPAPAGGIEAAAFALSEAQREPAQAPPAPPPVAAPLVQEPPPVQPPFVSAPPPVQPPPQAPPVEPAHAPVEPQPPAGPPGSTQEEPPVGTQWWSLKDSSRPGA